jgi:hypothetical protein
MVDHIIGARFIKQIDVPIIGHVHQESTNDGLIVI